ncbi:MAG TPA: ABC transporter permease [Microbacteriaceae bacterium]|nr:ABC transporter permease [Microbacteriaceae bacterium]
MIWFANAFAWLADPAHYAGVNGIPVRLGQHVAYTGITLVIAAAVALPLGFLIGHTGKGRSLAVQVSGGLRSLPTLGLVIVLALLLGLGIGAPMIALVILAVPPVLAGAYSGVESVDPRVVDAARAVGMTGWQVLWRVEVPLGLPLVIGGLRSAALQAIATWTVAAVLPLGGLGRYIYDAIATYDYTEMFAGSVLVIVLALVVDGLFAVLQRLVVPRGVVAAGGAPAAVPA